MICPECGITFSVPPGRRPFLGAYCGSNCGEIVLEVLRDRLSTYASLVRSLETATTKEVQEEAWGKLTTLAADFP